jgi:hypothetical protein
MALRLVRREDCNVTCVISRNDGQGRSSRREYPCNEIGGGRARELGLHGSSSVASRTPHLDRIPQVAEVFTEIVFVGNRAAVASCPHIWAAGAQPDGFEPNGCSRGDYFPVTAGTRRQRSSNVWPPISPTLCHTSPSMLRNGCSCVSTDCEDCHADVPRA